MSPGELRRRLLTEPVPGELEAARRSWAVVRAAFAAREPAPWPRRRARPLLALAAAALLAGAALGPPGRALAGWLREAVSPPPEPLVSLPAPGRLLAVAPEGVWVVREDGSKRLLGAYEEASWSPRGLFVAAAGGSALTAVEPATGEVRWTLSRPAPVAAPRWAPSGFRIAYLSGEALRVVAGDGTGDRLLAAPVAAAAPAWRPGRGHVLAYGDRRGRLVVVDADTGAGEVRARLGAAPRQLAWSPDGRLLAVLVGGRIDLYRAGGRRVRTVAPPRGATIVTAAFAPAGGDLAYVAVDRAGERSRVLLERADGRARTLFTGAGRLDELAWSPDGRWLAVGWPAADQWLFLRMPDVRRVVAVSDVRREFDPGGLAEDGPVAIAGWCCPP